MNYHHLLIAAEVVVFCLFLDKEFIIAFDEEMKRLGYTTHGTIDEGYCWEKHTIIYTKDGVKSKNHMPESICVIMISFFAYISTL